MNSKDSTINALLDGIDALFPTGSIAEVYAGSPPANANTAISGQTLLASITTGGTWAAATGRSKAKNETWQDSSANGGSADAPTFVRVKNAADTERLDFTAGVGTGEVQFDGSITAGQVVSLPALAVNG